MKISHRWRIALLTSCASGVIFAALLGSAMLLLVRREYSAAHGALGGPLDSAIAELEHGETFSELGTFSALPQNSTLAIFSEKQLPLYRTDAAAIGPWIGAGEQAAGGRNYVFRSRRSGKLLVVVATDWTNARAGLLRVGVILAALWLPLTLIVGLTAYLAAGLMFRPLVNLATQARVLAKEHRVGRLEDPNDADFSPLAQDLNALLSRLQAEIERQEQLVSDVAHDLRTPLTVIRGRLETALLTAKKDGYRAAMELAIQEAERLTDMTNAILEGEATEEEPAILELSKPLTDAADRWRPLFERAGIKLTVEAGSVAARIGSPEWQMLLDNLLENALTHSRADGACTVQLIASQAARLEIADTGPGVPEGDRERIFERFVRLDESRTHAGHGLGLYLCRRLVRARGGRIWVEANGTAGARFIVELPIAAVNA